MSQAVFQDFEQVDGKAVDPYEIGWYVESTDEETYGPVSRETLVGWLEDGTVSANTLVRHCTQPDVAPIAGQKVLQNYLPAERSSTEVGDRVEAAWPRKWREKLGLAQGSAPCVRHNQPATLVCIRCRAPYCYKCQMKPLKKPFFMCKKCQSSLYNRRIGALFVDSFIITIVQYALLFGCVLGLSQLGVPEQTAGLIGTALLFISPFMWLFRDSAFRGAGPGKRMFGLRVVRTADGVTPLSMGQGAFRWVSQFVPLLNLVDVLVPYRDPLARRLGDRWAKTRVVDAPRKLAKARDDAARRLVKKGVQPPRDLALSMQEWARLSA